MLTVYYLSKSITFCRENDPIIFSPEAVVLKSEKVPNIQDLSLMDKDAFPKLNIVFPCKNPEKSLEEFATQFKYINAGGGLVKHNKTNKYLLIYRNGLWDIPKGKQEANEDITDTALREVEEECGITGLKLGELICKTYHIYDTYGENVLKQTFWFNMESDFEGELTPQTIEDITHAKWCTKDEIRIYAKNTYPSLKKVFNNILKAN